MVHDTFSQWVEAEVIPLQQAHPDWLRLDGRDEGRNREIAGIFRYEGCIWEVHGNTRFEPVVRAYTAVQNKEIAHPFEIEWTKARRQCLVLKPQLNSPMRHFNVYAQG